jgi:hypothetical protein
VCGTELAIAIVGMHCDSALALLMPTFFEYPEALRQPHGELAGPAG